MIAARIAPLGAFALALSGCTGVSMNEVRATQPEVSYLTEVSVDATVRCLMTAFANTDRSPTASPSGRGWTLDFDQGNRWFVDVVPEGEKTRVSYYRHQVIGVSQVYPPAVNSCR